MTLTERAGKVVAKWISQAARRKDKTPTEDALKRVIAQALRKAMAEERQACAKICFRAADEQRRLGRKRGYECYLKAAADIEYCGEQIAARKPRSPRDTAPVAR